MILRIATTIMQNNQAEEFLQDRHKLKRARSPSPHIDTEHPTKHRRLDGCFTSFSPQNCTECLCTKSNSFPPLSEWPDDIIIHFLQYVEFETLKSIDGSCKRFHFIVQGNLKRLLEPVIASRPFSDEIQHLIQARAQFCSSPPPHSFGYVHLMQSIYADFETIANTANPVKKCPREVIHPDLDIESLRPSHIHFFRSSYCYYFTYPLQPIANFWTIFWEYKHAKAADPEGFHDKVAKWAWERYTYKEILGVALKMVLEIYKSRDLRTEIWSFNNGMLPETIL